jgi:hypothetical protein
LYSFWAPDDERRNCLKHVEHCAEINELCNVTSCWLYLKIHSRCTDPWRSKLDSYCLMFLWNNLDPFFNFVSLLHLLLAAVSYERFCDLMMN